VLLRLNFTREEMTKTRAFGVLWFCYTIGTLAGLMAIDIAKPVGMEVAAKAGMDATYTGVLDHPPSAICIL
jgi:hypothetical protein